MDWPKLATVDQELSIETEVPFLHVLNLGICRISKGPRLESLGGQTSR